MFVLKLKYREFDLIVLVNYLERRRKTGILMDLGYLHFNVRQAIRHALDDLKAKTRK